MRKFILSVLSVSVFFLGLGAIVKTTSAKFKSDEKALELVRKARTAIGGDNAIGAIQSLRIVGTTTRNIKAGNVDRITNADTEIALQLPDKLYKMEKIGDDNGAPGAVLNKQIEVEVVADAKDGNVEWKSDDLAAPSADRKIIIKKDDGTVEELKAPEAGEIRVRKADGGNMVWQSEDGKEITLESGNTFRFKKDEFEAARHNEILRMTLSLLMTAPTGMDVDYTYGGETSIDGTACSIVNATFGGATIKIFLNRMTNLPAAVSYMGRKMPVMIGLDKTAAPSGDVKKDVMIFRSNSDAPEEMAEHLVKFSDYRYVGGVQLPFRWAGTVGGSPDETFVINSYEINPVNVAEKFQSPQVMIRRVKEQ